MRKFFGIILYLFGALFILAFVGQIAKFIGAILSFLKIFSVDLNGSQIGYSLGQVFYWMLHFAVIYFAFKYGKKLLKKKPVKDQA
jgi:hypothetical protein